MTGKTLLDALRECLKDPQKASLYEAKAVREMILADGTVSHEERELLREALHNDKFDDRAVGLLTKLLIRSDEHDNCCHRGH